MGMLLWVVLLLEIGLLSPRQSYALGHDLDYTLDRKTNIGTDHSAFSSDCRPCPNPTWWEVLTSAAPPVDLAWNITGPVCRVSGGEFTSSICGNLVADSKSDTGQARPV